MQSSSASKLSSPKTQRWLLWISAAVLAAGVAAVLVAFLGNTGSDKLTKPTFTPGAPTKVPATPKHVKADPAVKEVAGKFILTAVQRQNLDQAWPLIGPGIRQGLTYKEWLTGNIPVQYISRKSFAGATYKVQWSHPNDVMLDVYIFGKPASLGQAFFMELKPAVTDGKKKWLVSYVVPNGGAQDVPALSPDGG